MTRQVSSVMVGSDASAGSETLFLFLDLVCVFSDECDVWKGDWAENEQDYLRKALFLMTKNDQ